MATCDTHRGLRVYASFGSAAPGLYSADEKHIPADQATRERYFIDAGSCSRR
jgi:hypothetical protein